MDAFAPLCYHGIGATSFLTGFVRISSEKLFRIGIRLFHLGVGLFGLGIGFGADFYSRRLFDMVMTSRQIRKIFEFLILQ